MTCPTCISRFQGECQHEALVGSGAEAIEGAPQTELGELILRWLSSSLIAVGGEAQVRAGAPRCPGWRRR
jgi:hypothetical protein